MHRLPAVQERDPDRVRRGAGSGLDHVRRRAARRFRRPGRASVCRAGRGDAAARDGVVYRGSEEGGRGIALVMSGPDDRGVRPGRATWLAVAAAVAVVVFLIVLMAGFWSGLGDAGMSEGGWVALVL